MQGLSKRERQIMDVVYELGEATATDIQNRLPDPPSNSAVRTHLRILMEKQHLQHRREGKSYVYFPTLDPEKAKKRALKDLIKTFFSGSVEHTVATLIGMSRDELSDEDLDRLSTMIDQAKKEGK